MYAKKKQLIVWIPLSNSKINIFKALQKNVFQYVFLNLIFYIPTTYQICQNISCKYNMAHFVFICIAFDPRYFFIPSSTNVFLQRFIFPSQYTIGNWYTGRVQQFFSSHKYGTFLNAYLLSSAMTFVTPSFVFILWIFFNTKNKKI